MALPMALPGRPDVLRWFQAAGLGEGIAGIWRQEHLYEKPRQHKDKNRRDDDSGRYHPPPRAL
jgi:hypothetical protein